MAHRILTPEEATAIQTKLNEKAYAQLVVDGHFGTLSQQALMRFQAEHNISPADGNPSQPTLDALGIPNLFSPPPKLTPNPMVQALASFAIRLFLQRLTKGTFIMDSTKPWYTSQTIWASALAILGTVLSFFHVNFGAADQASVVEAVLQIVTAASALWAIIGRLRASKAIG